MSTGKRRAAPPRYLFAECADGLSQCRAQRAATARNSPRCWTRCLELRRHFLSTLATFQCHGKTKRWSEDRWLAAFSDRDGGFAPWRRVPPLLLRHCSARSRSRNVTAKSAEAQRRLLLFFTAVGAKLVKLCDLENKHATPRIPLCSLRCSVCLLFSIAQKSYNCRHPFTILTSSGGGSWKWATSETCANDAFETCIETRDLPCASSLGWPVGTLIS